MTIAGLASIDTLAILHFASKKAIYSLWNQKISAETHCVV